MYLQYIRLSHSEIFGLMFVCNYPKLIAAYHVLHRLLVPRHPPCALIRFKYYDLSYHSGEWQSRICFSLLLVLFAPGGTNQQKLLSQYVKELSAQLAD